MKEFNINNSIKVKLTDFGTGLLNIYCKNNQISFDNYPVDENGYTQIPFVEVMMVFGQYFSYQAERTQLPFESNVMVSEQYLKDTSIENGMSR